MTRPGNRHRVTLREVAGAAGVSTATVTRVLQGSPRVEDATRQRVLDAVKGLGYSPNPIARNLKTGGQDAAVGLVTGGFTNLFQAGVAAGAERELRETGLHLIIGSTDDDPTREPELARTMIDRRVSVLMMMPDGDERGYLSAENTFGTPVILVGRPPNGLDADVVMTEDDRGVELATTQLLARGHRRIAALAGRDASFRTRQRLTGFRAALTHHGLTEDPRLTVTGLATPDQARHAVARLMRSPSPPTAVLGLNLGISTGVILERIASAQPFAFIALDEQALSIGLGVSAIVRDPQEVGRQAARLAVARIADPTRPATTVTVPNVLRERGSGEIPCAEE